MAKEILTTLLIRRCALTLWQALLLMQLEGLCRRPYLIPCEGAGQVPWSTLQAEMTCLVQPLPPAIAQMMMFAAEQLCSE